MPEIQNLKREYDLEKRTFSRGFGPKAVRLFVKTLLKTIANRNSKPVLITCREPLGRTIGYCNLRFICNLVPGI